MEIGWKEGGIKVVKKDDTAPVLSLDFDSKPSVSGQVRKLLPTIEHYKEQEGYSLRQIYDALQAKNYTQCAWPSFQNTYYRVRKEADDVQLSEKDAVQFSREKPVPTQHLSPAKTSRIETTVPSPKRKRFSKGEAIAPSGMASLAPTLNGGLDLEAYQAKARAVFDLKSLP